MTYKVVKDTIHKAGLQKPRLFRRIVFRTDKEISWTTQKERLLPPTRKDKPNKQMGMQIKCNNCLWQHLVRKIFICSGEQQKECKDSQGRSNKIYSHTHFSECRYCPPGLSLGHTSTPSPAAQSMKDSLGCPHCLCHTYMLPHCGSKNSQKNS